MNKVVVVATDVEEQLAKFRFPKYEILKTGVGGLNVIRTLRGLSKECEIINYGYVGSNTIPVGTEVIVNKVKLYHPNVDYAEPEIELLNKTDIDGTTCYTSNDFVLKTDIQEPAVFDMELAYICALGFKKVRSIKIVSDNLSLKQYEEENYD